MVPAKSRMKILLPSHINQAIQMLRVRRVDRHVRGIVIVQRFETGCCLESPIDRTFASMILRNGG